MQCHVEPSVFSHKKHQRTRKLSIIHKVTTTVLHQLIIIEEYTIYDYVFSNTKQRRHLLNNAKNGYVPIRNPYLRSDLRYTIHRQYPNVCTSVEDEQHEVLDRSRGWLLKLQSEECLFCVG